MSLLFTDLVKAMKPAAKTSAPSEERLNELLAQLFSSATDVDEEESAPAPKKSAQKGYNSYKGAGEMDKGGLSYFEGSGNGRDDARAALDKAAQLEIELDGEEDEEGEESEEDAGEMDKGAAMSDKEKRRELMSAAYSMIDNLSDEELASFLAAREVRKAQIMGVLSQMSTSELGELVSAEGAQGKRAVDGEKVTP